MKSSRSNPWARAVACVAVLGAALLASCGGGEQVRSFVASRVIAFGDETSVINADGSKYTVNALVSGSLTALECGTSPIWVQVVAAAYGLAFPQCPGLTVDPVSRIYAANGAKVADLAAQIDQQVNIGGGFVGTDLVTVLVGANDVLEQFAQYPAVGEAQLLANVDAAGAALAAQVNRLAGLGAKVLISTIPDMGRIPFAGDRSVGSVNGNPGVLTRLSTRFNDALLSRLLNDGHKIGLIQLDEYLAALDNARRAGVGSYANTSDGACAVALPGCTTATLVPDAVGAIWLWADDRRIGPSAQASLGSLALSRAQNNPF